MRVSESIHEFLQLDLNYFIRLEEARSQLSEKPRKHPSGRMQTFIDGSLRPICGGRDKRS